MLRKSSLLRNKATAGKVQTVPAPESTDIAVEAAGVGATTTSDPKKHDIDPNDIEILVKKIESDVIWLIDPRGAKTLRIDDGTRRFIFGRKRPH